MAWILDMHTNREVSWLATGLSSSVNCSTNVSIQLLRMSRSVSSDSLRRSIKRESCVRDTSIEKLIFLTLDDLAHLRGKRFLDYRRNNVGMSAWKTRHEQYLLNSCEETISDSAREAWTRTGSSASFVAGTSRIKCWFRFCEQKIQQTNEHGLIAAYLLNWPFQSSLFHRTSNFACL